MYVKRDMYVWQETYKRDLQLPVKEGCQKEVLTSFLPHSSHTAYLCQKGHVYMKKDMYIWKETCIYEKRPTKKDPPTLFHLWHDTCVQRDMYIWKETCIYEKRHVHMNRDLYKRLTDSLSLQPHFVYVKRDIYTWKETHKTHTLTLSSLTPQRGWRNLDLMELLDKVCVWKRVWVCVRQRDCVCVRECVCEREWMCTIECVGRR